MIYLRRIGIALLFAVAWCGCERESKEIIIISTNDIHAQIAQFPQLAAFVKEKRQQAGNVILVDAGDRFSGNPYVDAATEKGEPVIALMNALGYDVAAVGNHDFDYGQKVLKKRIEEAGFKVLCANIESAGSGLGPLEPYQMIEKAGIRFCFFSLLEIGASNIPATNPSNLKDITFRNYQDVAGEYKELEGKCDVLIGLTHLGFYNDSLLALVMPELDVIVGGHSHTLLRKPVTVNGVLIHQAGSNLQYAGVTTLRFKGKKLVDKAYSVVDLKEYGKIDTEIKLMVEEISNRPEFKRVLAKTTLDIKGQERVSFLMTDAMREAAGADFAFYNYGGIRMKFIPAGSITVEMVYKIEPFANDIVLHEWTRDEMKDFILLAFNKRQATDKHSMNYFFSGGKYEVIRDENGQGADVVFYDLSGQPLPPGQKKYKIAFSNYVDSSDDYVKAKAGKSTGIIIEDAVISYLEKKQVLSDTAGRIFLK